ncbi:hypothetical protein R1sor_025538 [Riccia sorocarpa]|uniref:Uncharacterized protein n=1 Tax=Riccia sorocarpa TaxID=122646 RepID=A0ABD3GBY4_9MARC
MGIRLQFKTAALTYAVSYSPSPCFRIGEVSLRKKRQKRIFDRMCDIMANWGLSLSPQFAIMSHILSNHITCSAAIKELLNEVTIVSCNEIVTGFNVDDHAIVVQLTNGLAIQAALALPSRPVGVLPSADQDGAMNNFRSWLISQAHEADGVTAANHQFGGANTTAWHHLSDEQAHDIVLEQWLILPWAAAIQAAGLAPIALVLRMTATGVGRAHMFVVKKIFG